MVKSLQAALDAALSLPHQASSYAAHNAITELHPGRSIFFTTDSNFDPVSFAEAGGCELSWTTEALPQIDRSSSFPSPTIYTAEKQGVLEVRWEGKTFRVVLMTVLTPNCGPEANCWIIGDSQEAASAFFVAVTRWNSLLHEEVYVFESGYWRKSEELFRSIREFTFDGLVLEGGLKNELRSDVQRFLSSRALYEEHHIPWKRGLLLIGPPGNGKTHAIRAIANEIQRPVLYVKTLKSKYNPPEESVRAVFEKARSNAPCLLVLEDLDSLLKAGNRAVFLNELDGFAANSGIVTIGSTNHPERLDASILERPSRFDRKFHFNLPGPSERSAYLELWNHRFKPPLRLSVEVLAGVVDETQGFSFAYLKELVLSSMVSWTSNPVAGGMEGIVRTQLGSLREQMKSGLHAQVGETDENEDDDE